MGAPMLGARVLLMGAPGHSRAFGGVGRRRPPLPVVVSGELPPVKKKKRENHKNGWEDRKNAGKTEIDGKCARLPVQVSLDVGLAPENVASSCPHHDRGYVTAKRGHVWVPRVPCS